MTGIHLTAQTTAGYIWAQILLEWAFPILFGVIGIAAFLLFFWPKHERQAGFAFGSLLGCFVIAAGFLGIFIGANWPLQEQYHQYVPTTITVAQIGNRFLAGDSGTNQRFVFLAKDGTPYAVDDTRAALVKVGDEVTLMCVREWQQNGVPGFACNWGEMGPNGVG